MLQVRWCAVKVLIVLLVWGSTVTGALTVQQAGARGAASPKVLNEPAGAVRSRDASLPAPQTLAALRARWPVHGPLNSGFGSRGRFWSKRFHAGVDIGARCGTPVMAPAAGTVTFAGWRRGYGRTIIIDHGHRVHSLYGHLSEFDVKGRQQVAAGARIGRTGTTGRSSGPHLHYEVLVNGRSINPRG